MSRYLMDKFVGTYRVLAELDQDTMDFVRDENGAIDKDFDDYYIPCRSGMRIKHGCGSTLWLYCPKIGAFYNVVRDYYKAVYRREVKDYNKCADRLLKDGYIEDVDFLDTEGCLSFKIDHMETISKIVKPKTYGAGISPHSVKNLPKTPYDIPKADMDKYKKAKEGIEPLTLGKINSTFGEQIWGDDYKKMLKDARLKAMQFFHKEGKWQEYCDYLKEVER